MAGVSAAEREPTPWVSVPDTSSRFSTGIVSLDHLLGGGFPRGSLVLLHTEPNVGPEELMLLLTPLLLNFLEHSNGVLAVLPARMSPSDLRQHLTRNVSRKLFDTRVRIVDYVGESEPRPYVVPLTVSGGGAPPPQQKARRRKEHMERMADAETAARGARQRMFLELNAFEIMEMLVGGETATRMFFHGIKRVHTVGNLCVGILRPGLACAAALRSMAEQELAVGVTDRGVSVAGLRPRFEPYLVVPDASRAGPAVRLLPASAPRT